MLQEIRIAGGARSRCPEAIDLRWTAEELERSRPSASTGPSEQSAGPLCVWYADREWAPGRRRRQGGCSRTALHRVERKRHAGTSHRVLEREGWPNCTFHWKDGDEIGPKMLSKIASRPG
jgi:hypothetical protein